MVACCEWLVAVDGWLPWMAARCQNVASCASSCGRISASRGLLWCSCNSFPYPAPSPAPVIAYHSPAPTILQRRPSSSAYHSPAPTILQRLPFSSADHSPAPTILAETENDAVRSKVKALENLFSADNTDEKGDNRKDKNKDEDGADSKLSSLPSYTDYFAESHIFIVNIPAYL
jgi:hypothetical protein